MVVPLPAVTATSIRRLWPGVNRSWWPGRPASSSGGKIDTDAPDAHTVTKSTFNGRSAVYCVVAGAKSAESGTWLAVRSLERQPKQIRVGVPDDTDQAQGVGLVGGKGEGPGHRLPLTDGPPRSSSPLNSWRRCESA